MRAVTTAGHTFGHAHGREESHGWRRWRLATCHKGIGTLYQNFYMAMFMFGGVPALLIRTGLFQRGLQFFVSSSTTST